MNNLITQKEIVYASFQMDKNGLRPIGKPTFEQWSACGDFLKNANGSVHFWIGDWMNYGESEFGESFAQAISDETGYALGTLSNDKWVASRIADSRRRETLSYGHHQEVADLMPDDQDKLLDFAQENKLPLRDFRNYVRDYKLRLDMPELTDKDFNKGSSIDFTKSQEYVARMLELTDDLAQLDWMNMDQDAKDFLKSQIKSTVGRLGRMII